VSADVSDLIRGYLTRTGWEQGPPGPAGALWRQGRTAIAVHEVIRHGSAEWRGVIDRLARHEIRSRESVAADIIGRPGEELPLTCECCKAAPATHLIVADFLKIRRVVKLACEQCGGRDIGYGKGQPPTQVRLYTITEVLDA